MCHKKSVCTDISRNNLKSNYIFFIICVATIVSGGFEIRLRHFRIEFDFVFLLSNTGFLFIFSDDGRMTSWLIKERPTPRGLVTSGVLTITGTAAVNVEEVTRRCRLSLGSK